MAERVVVTLVDDDKEVWSTEVKIEESTSTAPSTPSTSDPLFNVPRFGPRPKPNSTSSPVPSKVPLCPADDYPDSAPDFDEESTSTTPSTSLNGPLQLQAVAEEAIIANALEVEITKLVRTPPCPPGLRPKSLPQTHPLSQIQQQFQSEQRARKQLSEQQRQTLRRMRQIGAPEKQGQFLPTDMKPVVVRPDHSSSPSVLVPLERICKHCGAVNLLIKDPSVQQGGAPK
jgi:hypothetical protein